MTEQRIILVLIALISVAFAWVIWPLFGAVFWAIILVIVFDPLYRRLLVRLHGRKNAASAIMIVGILLMVIIPTILIIVAIVNEVSNLLAAVQSGDINLHILFLQFIAALPDWLKALLSRLGFGNLEAVLESSATSMGEWVGANAQQVLSIGTMTASFVVSLGVMLYLTFFLFRDGDKLVGHLRSAIPLRRPLQATLLDTFTTVVRATVKGDILVALLQGALGGLGLWVLGVHAAMLWMVVMAFVSLFPVFGAALVWLPIALYFLANGQQWQGLSLIAYGVLVIGLIDNIVRPYLVGQSTRLPDYVVLISTIGGIATFGLQGFISGPVIAAMFIAVWATFLSLDKD